MASCEGSTNVMRLLKYFIQSKNYKINKILPSYLCVGNTHISGLKALGSGMFKPAITKAGQLSLQGKMPDNRRVKIQSCFRPSQIPLRLELERLQPNLPIKFPRVVSYDEFLLVEEWIDGTPLNKLPSTKALSYASRLYDLLNQFQNDPSLVALAQNHLNSFCYLNDYLISRLNVWSHWQPVKALIEELRKSENSVAGSLPNFLSHPDLSLSNLILEHSTDKLYVIDNELFGVGQSWVIDGKNSFCKESYKINSLDTLSQRFASLSWKCRLVGSALDAGDFERAERLARFE